MAVLKRTEGNGSCHIENRKQVFFKKSFRTLNYRHFRSDWTPIERTKNDGKCRLQSGNQAQIKKSSEKPSRLLNCPLPDLPYIVYHSTSLPCPSTTRDLANRRSYKQVSPLFPTQRKSRNLNLNLEI